MARFDSIYPFTTENIAGYMNDLDLTGKKVITVTGSSDHIINAILKGCKDITTFDINPLTKKYMALKLAVIKSCNYREFVYTFLQNYGIKIDSETIMNLDMSEEDRLFWIRQVFYTGDFIDFRYSKLFNSNYYSQKSKYSLNMYLDKDSYSKVQESLRDTHINFINKSIKDLKLDEYYDYMFLSNISDYINLMYNKEALKNYKILIKRFLERVNNIYFAYLYDIGNSSPRSEIDDLKRVKEEFGKFDTKIFKSALENEPNKKDGVLILRRN